MGLVNSQHASRFGIVSSTVLPPKKDWYDDSLDGAVWYLTRHGFFNGASTYICIDAYIDMCNCVYIYMYICICIYVYIYIYM